MDGVIVDFAGPASVLHGLQYPYSDPRNYGEWSMHKIFGMNNDVFVADMGYEFWVTLPKMDDADEIIRMLVNMVGWNNIALFTAPVSTHGCYDGKKDWVKKHYPQLVKLLHVGDCKHFIAANHLTLIDDRDENIRLFEEAGGNVVRFPRPWNSDWGLCGDPVSVVRQRLVDIKNRRRIK